MSLALFILGVLIALVLLPWLVAAVGMAFWATSRCRNAISNLRSSHAKAA